MSFHFLRLTLRDWLVYEGEVSVSFGPPQDGHNIWVIYGLNGYGKTSLLRAIQWLFHGQMPDRHVKTCFNHQAVRAGRNELSVSAEFTYHGHHYHLVRRAEASINNGEVVGYPKETVELAIDQESQNAGIADKIDQILPKECQQFFFFDGLEIEKYATDTHTDETQEAIETVLGIPEVRNLSNDLEKLSQDLERERDRLLRDQSAYEDLSDQKEEAKVKLEAAKETLRNLRSQHNSLQEQINRLEERASTLKQAEDEIAYLRDLRHRKQDLNERLNNYEAELQGYLKVVAQRMVLPLLKGQLDQLQTQVNKAERTGERLAQAKAQTDLIGDLLNDTFCVCGRELNTEARRFLENKLRELEDQLASSRRLQERVGSYTGAVTELKDLESRIRYIEGLADPDVIQRALLTKYKLQVGREEVEQEIAAREKKLEGSKDADVGQVFTTLGEKKQNLADIEGRIKSAEEEVKKEEKLLDERQDALNEAARAIDDKRRVVDALQLTRDAHAVAREMVGRLLRVRRDAIERHMTSVFRMVTNKKQEYDRIELAEDFAPCIVTHSGQMMKRNELSAGEKEVVAFSFIAGLNQSTQTNAPLVMDTPFGHLDVSHRNGLLEALPKLPCQVVLLATDRDLPEEELPNLAYCLGGRMDIIRDEIGERSRIETTPL